jgi:hypothetical protein
MDEDKRKLTREKAEGPLTWLHDKGAKLTRGKRAEGPITRPRASGAAIPEKVWAVGKVRPLGERTIGVYYDTPIKASEREGAPGIHNAL